MRRHEVGEPYGAVGSRELGFQDQGIGTVAAGGPGLLVDRRDQPPTMVGRPQQRGEAGAAVEARQAQPVDRASVRDQGRGLAVADQAVILDPLRHGGCWSPKAWLWINRCGRWAVPRWNRPAEVGVFAIDGGSDGHG